MSNVIQLTPKRVPPKINIGIVCAARMTSTRFPGKSMALLLNKPLIQWTLERAKQVKGPKGVKPIVILAVPDTPASEPMLQLAEQLEVENFCGSELNVLSRFYNCAKFFKLNVIVRLTCDCPFIDPIVCTEVLKLLLWKKLDYTSNVYPKRTYPKGLDCEAFTFDAIEAAYKMADSPYDLEHVTPWLQRTEGVLRGLIQQRVNQSDKNWCVDFLEDIERLTKEITKFNIIKLKAHNENV